MSYLYNDDSLGLSCIVSQNRSNRPKVTTGSKNICPFCQGNEQMLEHVWLEKTMTDGDKIRVVNNKYSVTDNLLEGVHEVIIDTLHHEKALYQYTVEHWVGLFEVLQERWQQIAANDLIECIQIFKNNGEKAGASITHQHWQIIALHKIPLTMEEHYQRIQKLYVDDCIFCRQLQNNELGKSIIENDDWQALSPFAATFPHETWLVTKQHKAHFGTLDAPVLKNLGKLMSMLTKAYQSLLPDTHYNICLMSGRPSKDIGYHFYIKILPRIGNIAGFELATQCHINSVEPREHAMQMAIALEGVKEENYESV